MTHEDHLNLIRGGIPGPGGIWADLGSGTGAFTLALADLVGPTGHIYSVDRDKGALREQERSMQSYFPHGNVRYITADFTRPLDLPPLDGVIMANSLHFHRFKDPVLKLVQGYLRPGGHLIIVEIMLTGATPGFPTPSPILPGRPPLSVTTSLKLAYSQQSPAASCAKSTPHLA